MGSTHEFASRIPGEALEIPCCCPSCSFGILPGHEKTCAQTAEWLLMAEFKGYVHRFFDEMSQRWHWIRR